MSGSGEPHHLETWRAVTVALHVYVDVEDLDAGIRFYRDGLGLTLRRRLAPNWVELEGAAVPVFLLRRKLDHRDTGAQMERTYERHWTPVHLDFLTDDLEAALARAEAAGARRDRDVVSAPWGRMASLSDPFGNGFDLIELGRGGYEMLS
jgi:predicted enzyme related to lactoylglutathione lyase